MKYNVFLGGLYGVFCKILISVDNGTAAQPDDTYKILFFYLLGIIMLSPVAFMIFKK